MNRVHRPRRLRVALRPKVRRRRVKLAALLAALAAFAGAAALAGPRLGRGWQALLLRLSPRTEAVTVAGVPALLAEPMARFLNEPGAAFSERCAQLAERFPAVKTVRVRRAWLRRGARVEATLRRAVGRVQRDGRPAGFLDEGGVVFGAPEALYPEARLAIAAGGAGAEQLRALVPALETLAREGGLPSPVARAGFRSAYEGWEFSLQDGTQLLWGDLERTQEKLARLREALSDARERFPGAVAADLRYFADGRVLLRPQTGSRL